MKVVKCFFMCFIFMVLFSGCGMVSGFNETNYPTEPSQTQVILNNKNFRVIKSVQGLWSATYVFGIGGLSSCALYHSALADMYCKAEITDGQAVINITSVVSTQQIIWGFYVRRTAIVTGTVIEFLE